MTVYHLEFAKTGHNLSGGEVWMTEVIKQLQAKGLKNVLLTTDNAKQTYERIGLIESDTLTYQIIESYQGEQKLPLIASYVARTLQACALVRTLKLDQDDMIICHSDFFPNSVPFYVLARQGGTAKLFCLFHMLAPGLFRGYEGHFTNRFQLPKLTILHYRLNQRLYRQILRKTGAAVITNNQYYAQLLERSHLKGRINVLKRFAGAEQHDSQPAKIYDILWMGRFHPQKGLLEVPAILEQIKRQVPELKVLILGGAADDDLKQRFLDEIARRGLTQNVEMKGFVVGEDKYRYICQSKVFLMTSFYESFGMVNLEALKNGVPVVAYDLPIYSVFSGGMVKVPVLDRAAMAEQAVRLLNQASTYQQVSAEAREFASSFSWQNTGDEIYRLLLA